MFKGPLETMQANYFSVFGHGQSPSAATQDIQLLSPIDVYLDSQ